MRMQTRKNSTDPKTQKIPQTQKTKKIQKQNKKIRKNQAKNKKLPLHKKKKRKIKPKTPPPSPNFLKKKKRKIKQKKKQKTIQTNKMNQKNQAEKYTPSAPWLKGLFPAECCASGRAEGQRLSVLTCLGGTDSARSESLRVKKKKSSPHGPHIFVSLNS